MSTVNPPIQLENNANQFRVDYIQEVASQPDFDYPAVRLMIVFFFLSAYANMRLVSSKRYTVYCSNEHETRP